MDIWLGFVRYGRPSAGSHPSGSHVGELLTVYVSAEYRGKGIGGQLISVAEQELSTLGFEEGLLFVLQDLARSVKFYERCGWSWTGDYEVVDFGGFGQRMLRVEKRFD